MLNCKMPERSLHFFDDVPLEALIAEAEGDEIVEAIHRAEDVVFGYFDRIIEHYNPEIETPPFGGESPQ